MSRRSEGDAMPGWSTVLRVDKAALGLDEVAPAPVVDEGTLHDGQEASPFDETTEPPAFAPVAPPAAPSVARSGIRAPPSRPSAAPASRAAPSARYDRPIETVAPEEYTQLDQPAPAELRSALADERTVDTSPADKGARPAGGVQVEGVVGERIPAVVVRRAPAPSPAPRGAEAGARGDRRLENAPVTAGGPRPSTSHAELTQINAAAALGIAPEPAAPPPSLGPARVVDDPGDRTPPPTVGRVDFGPLRLADKEEVLARYPVEAPGIGAAERLGEKAPLVRTVSKLLPVLFVAMIALSFVGVFLVGPLGDLLQAGQRQSAREALREAQLKSEASATADEGHTLPSGSIRVVTRPTRASIEVDGYYLGRSPMMIAPPEERPLYEFRISADGHRTWHGTLRFVGEGYVLERSEASESVGPGVLTPEGAQHRLSVELDPATP